MWFPSYHQRLGFLKALPQSCDPVSCLVKGSCTGATPTEWVFRCYVLSECFLRNEGFYGGWSAYPATILFIKSNPTAGGHQQTQLGTRYGWPLAHKELLRPLTGFVLHSAGCPYHTPSSPENLVGRRFTRRQPDHEIGEFRFT